MLQSLHKLLKLELINQTGEKGRLKDIFFNEKTWSVEYLVADFGDWMESKTLLIKPQYAAVPNWQKSELPVFFSKEEASQMPSLADKPPVSHQYEKNWFHLYGWPAIGLSSGVTAPVYMPSMHPVPNYPDLDKESQKPKSDLRSILEVTDYSVETKKNQHGFVNDFLFDSQDWKIRYVVVNSSSWLPGKSVLISTNKVKKLNWPESSIRLDVTKDAIQSAPSYDKNQPVHLAFEMETLEHFKNAP